jgi:5-(carboxyamino)imidazole ribonucleotide synthase
MTVRTKRLGILGGGQLGRMSALAAANLGIESVVFTPEENSPASQVVRRTIVAPYEDENALREFVQSVDAITYEFENIPLTAIAYLRALKPVIPDCSVLEISQHRVREKEFLNSQGVATARWKAATSFDHVTATLKKWNSDACILKTCRFGYDGKGQIKLTSGDDHAAAWRELGSQDNIIEELIDFECEISVVLARDVFGKTEIYDPVLNSHVNHILSETIAPAPLPEDILDQARRYSLKIADALDLVGVLAIEFFVTRDGRVLANEMAPRPHNSGHWTMNACAVSQFENHVRTVCGLPVGKAGRHSDARMINLIGQDVDMAESYLSQPDACIHLYGKTEARPGRKMGHVNLLERRRD